MYVFKCWYVPKLLIFVHSFESIIILVSISVPQNITGGKGASFREEYNTNAYFDHAPSLARRVKGTHFDQFEMMAHRAHTLEIDDDRWQMAVGNL